jgi:hypothetical protein
MKRILPSGLVALVLAATVYAESPMTGKWQGTTASGTPVALDLTATETELTGTLTRSGERVTIMDGTVSKNTFTFKATIRDQTEGFSGEFAGDEIRVWMDRRPENVAVLKRVKK